MTARFAYDDVPYDTEANADAHPSAMATLGRLHGMSPKPPSIARVLEIGCGNGENLLAAATYLPDARFVGFDLAATAIEAGAKAAPGNVVLFAADIRDVRRGSEHVGPGTFDYVVAHGMLSWVPDAVRDDLLALMRDALAPNGIGFLSFNALPGWELRRALRELARDRTSAISDPAEKVAATMKLVRDLAATDAPGWPGALAAAAREYEAHVAETTPPGAPFARYVFHDLLADHNEPFSVAVLTAHLAAHGLRIVSETPLRRDDSLALADAMNATGLPFLQVLVRRDDAPVARDPLAIGELWLWADFEQVRPGTYRTTTGAVVTPAGTDGLARAIAHAPGFVAVRELVDPASMPAFAQQLLDGLREGVFTLALEPPPAVAGETTRPRVASHVRARASAATTARQPSAVLTNALHRCYRVPWPELAVVGLFDGRPIADVAPAAREAAEGVPAALAGPLAACTSEAAARFVATVGDRFRRHLFLVGAAEPR